MNYFTSSLHGNAEAYFNLKQLINFKKNDELYILGDILDGNAKNPQACLDILEDIMLNDNIHLILGNHEYAHALFHASQNDDEMNEIEQMLTNTLFPGDALIKHMLNSLSDRELKRYVSFLISCNVSQIIKIGSRYFYLCHGAPVPCKADDFYTWQKRIVTAPIAIEKNYFMAIKSDPDIQIPEDMTPNNTIVLCGHTQSASILEQYPALKSKYYAPDEAPYQKVLYENKKMIINCGCSQDAYPSPLVPTLACVGIDAAGFFTEYIREFRKKEV